ncbi:hypothetical protein POSPLADRAFT_1043659 [Postia placenta MAD-698-R-SB12]|uniref:NACHT domain-containing protein n=1 Tax=Postia placenta MAD-698-R-SB12 TaxID=670580 RepID=A0A1X6NC08_9APHY|nr:hypothetical protein POSPLADRAFT_1043659 [Postia placenta MAD-698-R-SB12]OSX66178.1 hypothetical protein POSPLADRAFT_1043659 [Postia placenta MAD-698-R-SB12]
MSCLPVFRRHNREEIVDDILHGTLVLLETAGDGLSYAPIQGLDTAASALSSIVKMIIKTRDNDQTAVECAEAVNELAALIKETMQKTDSEVKSVQKLDELKDKAGKLKEPSPFLRCLRSEQNAKILDSIKEGITNARSNFTVQGIVMVELLQIQMVGKIEDVGEAVQRMEQAQRFSQEEELLARRLPHRNEAEYRSAINSTKNGYLQGTRVELLGDLEAWAKAENNVSHPPIFVLTGAAGTGKSTVAYELARRLEANSNLGASFFFVRGDADLSTTKFVFPSIAYQLARSHPTLRSFILDACREHLAHGETQDIDFQLNELIIEPLKRISADHAPITIILDALDECTELALERIPRMLYILMQRSRNIPFPLRILITTRPELQFEDAFMSVKSDGVTKMLRLQDIPRAVVDHDIKLYLDTNLTHLREFGQALPAAAQSKFIDELTRRADGLFIYATTVIRILRGDPNHLLENMDSLLVDTAGAAEDQPDLSELDRLYLVALKHAFPIRSLGFPKTVKAALRDVFGVLALLQDHVSALTIQSLLNIPVADTQSILHRAGAVIFSDPEDKNAPIRPLHASFPQFLIDPDRCTDGDFCVSPSAQHGLHSNMTSCGWTT